MSATTSTTSRRETLRNGTAGVPTIRLPQDYMAEAQRAISDNKKGGELLQAAEQRMAYAIIVWAASIERSAQNPSKHTLVKAWNTKDARDWLFSHAKDVLLPTVPVIKVKDLASDRQRDDNVSVKRGGRTVEAMYAKGFSLALLLARDGVTYNDFNHQRGNFFVPSIRLMPRDEKNMSPRGRLATETKILLDGRGIHFATKAKGGGDLTREATASVSHYRMMNQPRGKARAAKTKETGASVLAELIKNIKAEDMADNADRETLMYATHENFVSSDTGTEGDAGFRRSELTSKTWECWAALAQCYFDTIARPGFEDGPPKAVKVAKAAAKAAKAEAKAAAA